MERDDSSMLFEHAYGKGNFVVPYVEPQRPCPW